MPLPAALEIVLLGAWGAIFLVVAVLIAGWITRTSAVIVVAMLLIVLAAIILAVGTAYELDGDQPYHAAEMSLLRFTAGIGAALLVVAVWSLIKLRVAPSTRRPSASAEPEPLTSRYGRDWLLSLLQTRAGATKENFATPTDRDAGPAERPSATRRGNPPS